MCETIRANAVIQAKFRSEELAARSIEQHYARMQANLFLFGAIWSLAASFFFEVDAD